MLPAGAGSEPQTIGYIEVRKQPVGFGAAVGVDGVVGVSAAVAGTALITISGPGTSAIQELQAQLGDALIVE